MGQFGFGFSHSLGCSKRMRRRRAGHGGRRGRHTHPSRPAHKHIHIRAVAAEASCSSAQNQRGAACSCSACTGKRRDSGVARFQPNAGIGVSRAKVERRLNRNRHRAYEALCDACREGDMPALRQLLHRKALQTRAHGTDGLGRTVLNWHHRSSPLCIAAEGGRADVVALLLRCGADVGQTGSAGQTPLQSAAAHGRTAVVKELLLGGASLDAGTSDWHAAVAIIAKSALRHWASSPGCRSE
mmetsp:Transcript_90819/g.257264  ORF Transcript_90819/g.257264 Transcript_90819/m.257264 type:complete len:242 (-) Transcript_90819:73-798(-)